MMYLENNIDGDVYNIMLEVFKDDICYFQNYEKEYFTFKALNILNNIMERNNNSYFLEAKNELKNCDLNLTEISLVKKAENISEYKINLFKYKLDSSKKEYGNLLKENEELKKEFESEKKFNCEVLNSKSWKLMNSIRRFRG